LIAAITFVCICGIQAASTFLHGFVLLSIPGNRLPHSLDADVRAK